MTRKEQPQNRRIEWRRMLKRACITMLALAAVTLVAIPTSIEIASRRLDPPPIGIAQDLSVTVLDRKNRLLRAYATQQGRWRLPVETAEIDQRYIRMLMTYEDRRFHDHAGIDFLAIGRACWQMVRHRKIVSGASTLSMQVARLVLQKHERTASGKFRQMIRARQLERLYSKQEILRLYFTLAPFGGNLEGVRAASLAYFGREPRRLSVAESALLVALPQSPEARRPDRHPKRAKRARHRVLLRMQRYGIITATQVSEATKAPIPTRRINFPLHAPHLSDEILANRVARPVHRSTIDRSIQKRLEQLAKSHATANGERLSAAAMIVDNRTGHILAHVGSADYLDQSRFGAIDMTSAIRSPGSTLKPIVYGLAFERGFAHPETLIEDRAVRFGSYAPKNFDERYRGTVTIRQALQLSLNIPAVKALAAVGPSRLLSRLRNLGAGLRIPDQQRPSLAIALGGLGMSLKDLVAIYTSVARGGDAITLKQQPEPASQTDGSSPSRPRQPILSPTANWYITNILSGTPPPRNARRGRIAYKTGTSYGFRDAWAVGFDGSHTIAVWIGRPDGAATSGLTGLTAAAPFLFDAFAQVTPHRTPLAAPPRNVIRRTNRNLPPPLRRFRRVGTRERDGSGSAIQIAFPPNNSEFAYDDFASADPQPLLLRADGGAKPFSWFVDGTPISAKPHQNEAFWAPTGRGFVLLSVVDANGKTDRVRIRLK